MWDLNKNKVRRGETPFNVRFRYMPIPPESNSYFNLSFQETLRSGLVPNTSSYVQEAVKKLLLALKNIIWKFKIISVLVKLSPGIVMCSINSLSRATTITF